MEQYVVLAVSAPILSIAGALAFWLYEPRQRTFWTVFFAVSIALTFTAVAPTLLLRNKPFHLALYWASLASFTAILVLLGSGLTAMSLRRVQRPKGRNAA